MNKLQALSLLFGFILFFLSFLFIITWLGVISNYLSFSFLRKEQAKSLTDKLIKLLNATNLTVCFLVALACIINIIELIFVENSVHEPRPVLLTGTIWITKCMFTVLVMCTAMVTCLISVIRTLIISNPFFDVTEHLVRAIVYIFFAFAISLNIATAVTNFPSIREKTSTKVVFALQYIFAIVLGLIILAVIVSSIICAYQLKKNNPSSPTPSADDKNYTTVTILVISTIFCTINIIYLACFCYFDIKLPEDSQKYEVLISITLILLNSILNPAVFLIRNEHMREYSRTTAAGRMLFRFTRLCCCCCNFCCCRKKRRIGSLSVDNAPPHLVVL